MGRFEYEWRVSDKGVGCVNNGMNGLRVIVEFKVP